MDLLPKTSDNVSGGPDSFTKKIMDKDSIEKPNYNHEVFYGQQSLPERSSRNDNNSEKKTNETCENTLYIGDLLSSL